MSWRSHLAVWLGPTVYATALVLMFFSGVPLLREIVAPAFSREFGLLESSQALVLLVAIGVAAVGLRRAAAITDRAGFLLLSAVFLLLFLEEINYGEHYWKWLNGQPLGPVGRGNEFNLHNQMSTSPLKTAANVVLLVFFVILPLVVRERAPQWLRFMTPPRALILTVLASVAVSQLAHAFDERDPEHALGRNIAEFRELFIYYIGALYAHTLAFRRRWPGWKGELAAARHGEGT